MKTNQTTNFEGKYMALKRFEFQEQLMTDISSMKLTQFEKTGSKGKFFITLGYL